jgi:hypothetical protein
VDCGLLGCNAVCNSLVGGYGGDTFLQNVGNPEDGGNTFLRNVGNYKQDYTAFIKIGSNFLWDRSNVV